MNKKTRCDSGYVFTYAKALRDGGGRASDCIVCGRCEKACPQHLKIRDLLLDCSKALD